MNADFEMIAARLSVLEAAVLALASLHPQPALLLGAFEHFVDGLGDLPITEDAANDAFSALLTSVRATIRQNLPPE